MIRPLISCLSLLFTITILYTQGCKRPDNTGPAGKGGTATLSVAAKHHAGYIDGVTIYLKYNAQDVPADGKYDDSAICVAGNGDKPLAVFNGLKKGEYYIHGKGYDEAYDENVAGGAPFTITEEKPYVYDIKVTGDH